MASDIKLADDTLSIINNDQSFETVQTVIGSILEMIDDYQWTIGSILVFIRFRAAHIPIERFDRPADKSWPEEFLIYLRKLTGGLRPEQCDIADELLHWNRLGFDKHVVLYDEKEITLWEKTDDPFTDFQYQKYLDMLTANLARKLNGKTMWAYYITAKAFPVSARAIDRTWTFHYDTYRYYQLKHENADVEDAPNLIVTPSMQLEEFIENDIYKTVRIRAMMREERDKKQGYKWVLDVPYEFKIKVGDEQKTVIIFDESSANEDRGVIFAGADVVYKSLFPNKQVRMSGNKLYIDDRYVGYIPLLEKDEYVDKAIFELSGKMKWSITG